MKSFYNRRWCLRRERSTRAGQVLTGIQYTLAGLFAILCGFGWVASAAAGVFNKTPFSYHVMSEDQPKMAKRAIAIIQEQREASYEFSSLETPRDVAAFDRQVLKRWMTAQGYYANRVRSRIQKNQIVYELKLGPPYLIRQLNLNFSDGILDANEKWPLKKGDKLRAESVLKMQQRIEQSILRNHCFFNVQVNYQVVVDHDLAQAQLLFEMVPSEQATFGHIKIKPIAGIKNKYLKNYIPFKKGDCYKLQSVDEARLAMLQTHLLSSVNAEIDLKQRQVDVVFSVEERKHRTLKLGAGYASDVKGGVSIGWENRNLSKRGERLNVDTELAELERSLAAEITVPHFKQSHQTLTLHTKASHELPDAYEALRWEAGAQVARELKKRWKISVGVGAELSHIIENENKEDFGIVSAPIALNYLRTNDLLNPTSGWSLGGYFTPYIDLYNTGTRFTKTSLAATQYWQAETLWAEPVLALRLASGVLHGESLAAVPAAYRYYVGGGGSVRGYAHQTVGSSTQGEPDGGLAFSEVAMEIRLRFSENWGGVIFSDGGYAFADQQPRWDNSLMWSAGFGVRYFTSFAPFRADIGFPLEKRVDEQGKRVDDPFQIYISIGQAF